MSFLFDDNLFFQKYLNKKVPENEEDNDSEYQQMSLFELMNAASDDNVSVSATDIDNTIRALHPFLKRILPTEFLFFGL